ncbi:MAG TPA: DUF6448 family protein [Burkholderiaceae bacterium]|nr:DUF6448 family protein [Burkholderiaceae bacterium]
MWLASSALALLSIVVFAQTIFALDGAYHLPPAGALLFGAGGLVVFGHCDTLDGPLVTFARKALETGNVNLVLPWVRKEDEAEVRRVFDHAGAVRKLGPEARDLADMHFFETLVRIHRAGEGAPYTGLKLARLDLGPAVVAADRALETGSPDALINLLTDAVRAGIHRHFHAAHDQRRFDANDVAAGRQYVEAYVPYLHYVEGVWEAATDGERAHHSATSEPRRHAH